jgi:methionyl aminopeptidase
MRVRREPPIQVKTGGQLAVMREAGLVVAHALRTLAAAVEPGISTADLDAIAEREIRAAGAVPSFKGYHGFPASICTSVNDQIVHGIPSASVQLAAGDVISIDCGAIVGGWHGDAAVTVSVGPVGAELAGLVGACEQAMWHGLAKAVAGNRLTDISHAVEASARASGRYGIIQEYTGHGIGSQMHMDPAVPNYGKPGQGPELAEGMALAIEPMLVLGRRQTRLLDDGWTVVSADGTWAAHFEHTVAITADGPWVLTAEDGGASGWQRLAAQQAGQPAGRAAASHSPDSGSPDSGSPGPGSGPGLPGSGSPEPQSWPAPGSQTRRVSAGARPSG